MTGVAMVGNIIRSSGQNLRDHDTGEEKDASTLIHEGIRRWGGFGPFDYAYRYRQEEERNIGTMPQALKSVAGPLPQDVFDSFLYRRGFMEAAVQNLPFYSAYDLMAGPGSRKRLRAWGREFDQGKEKESEKEKEPTKLRSYYAKGGLVFNVPNVKNEPDEMVSRVTGVPFNETAGVIMEDEEERGISKQMERLKNKLNDTKVRY